MDKYKKMTSWVEGVYMVLPSWEGFGMSLKSSFLHGELRRLWDFKEICLLRKFDMYKDCPRREYI